MVSTNPKSWATLPRRVSALALAGVVAFANVPAVALAQGASVPAQTHATEDAATMVSIRFIGPGADGEPVLYAALEDQGIPAGLTAADVTRAALANSGLTYDGRDIAVDADTLDVAVGGVLLITLDKGIAVLFGKGLRRAAGSADDGGLFARG